jgi:hypothetical protein
MKKYFHNIPVAYYSIPMNIIMICVENYISFNWDEKINLKIKIE